MDEGEGAALVEGVEAAAKPRRMLAAVVVYGAPDRFVTPPDCACCGALALRTRRETRWDGGGLLVPVCSLCHAHAARDDSRRLAVTLASLILAVTALAGLPLVFQPPLPAYGLAVLAFGLLPAVIGSLTSRPPLDGHATAGRAVFFRWDGALVCRSAGWGRRLAEASHLPCEARNVREPVLARFGTVGVVLAVVLSAFLHPHHFPEVRIVNLGASRIDVFVDGRPKVSVNPTSAESPSAGVVVRLRAGQRTLRAVNADGVVVDAATVMVRSGAAHLYAPGSPETCFYIETIAYGRSLRDPVPPDEPLVSTSRFWAIPSSVDFWFSPAPVPDRDERSSGGLLRALRQAPCERVRRRAGTGASGLSPE